MSRTRKLFAGVAALAMTSSGALAASGVSWADPSPPPQPIDAAQAPAMAAMQQLGPAVQQAAANPTSAASPLMAAASAFAGNSAAPDASKQVASSVSQFVQQPAGAAPAGMPLPQQLAVPADLSKLLPAGVNLPGIGGPPPEAHVPAPGAIPRTDAHLPAGIDPAHAVGPAPEAAPAAAATPAPAAAPAPAPSAAPDPAPAPRARAGARPRSRARRGRPLLLRRRASARTVC